MGERIFVDRPGGPPRRSPGRIQTSITPVDDLTSWLWVDEHLFATDCYN